jgi:hypothetical protein
MKLAKTIFIFISACAILACSSSPKATTPLEALKLYSAARKKKDVPAMRNFLSKGSIKMAEDDAKAQNRPIDEVLLNDTLFPENVSTVEYKNESKTDENATIEVKNQFGIWDRVPFIKEDGEWKIAKEKFADEFQKFEQESNQKLDEQINQGKQP